MAVTCPRCKRGRLRIQVSVFVDAPADCHDLSKRGLRSRDIQILGAGWPQATYYCDAGCGHVLRLATGRRAAGTGRRRS